MTDNEIAEVISKGQEDGATLYRVADALYKVAMAFNGPSSFRVEIDCQNS